MTRHWMKLTREQLGMTMKDVADKLNISESYYCSIENGIRQKKMDVSLAASLSAIFGLPISQIIENEMALSGDVPGGVSA